MWLPGFGLLIGFLLPNQIVEHLDLSGFWVWPILLLIILFVLGLLFLNMPLYEQCENEHENIHESESDTVFAVIRPYSQADKVLFFSSLLLFFSSVGLFAATYYIIAKLLFMFFVILFGLFLVSRIKMQFSGMRIILLNVSDNTINFTRLKTLPFFETEMSGIMKIPLVQVAGVVVNRSVSSGAVSDPSYTIGFNLTDGKYLYNEIPYQYSGKVNEILAVLKSELPEAVYEIDPSL